MSDNQYIVVFVTAANTEEAGIIRDQVLKNKLAACVNTTDINSIFFWKDKLETAEEILMIMKTRSDLFEQLEKTVKQYHSYEVPEIIALPVIKGSNSYLNWIEESTK